MTETTVQEQDSSTTFWSPWIVFFFGIPFAALNWLRMNKGGKAIIFLVLSLFVALVNTWADFNGTVTPTDYALSKKIEIARFFIISAFSGLLAIIMSIDIQQFMKEEKFAKSVKWQAILAFWAILFLFRLGIWTALDYAAKEMGKCQFPRLQDVLYQQEFEQRTGLASLVLGRYDFGCDWIWDIERGESDSERSYHLIMIGDLKSNKDSSMWVFEQVFIYDEVTEDVFAEIASRNDSSEGSEYTVHVEDPNALYSNVACAKFEKFTLCNLIFGYQSTIKVLNLTFWGLSDEQINELTQLIVSINSQRIYEYETK